MVGTAQPSVIKSVKLVSAVFEPHVACREKTYVPRAIPGFSVSNGSLSYSLDVKV